MRERHGQVMEWRVLLPNQPIEEALRRLRTDFVATLPERLQAVRQSIAQARVGGGPTAASGARTVVHQLRGTGASFGLPELSDAAGLAETLVRRYEAVPSADVWPDVERALADMDELCRREGVG